MAPLGPHTARRRRPCGVGKAVQRVMNPKTGDSGLQAGVVQFEVCEGCAAIRGDGATLRAIEPELAERAAAVITRAAG